MKAQLEKVISPPQGSFKCFTYKGETFDAPWHFHPEYELTYISKSNGMRYVGDSVMEFESGDLVLLGSNLPHCWKNTEHQKELAESIVVQWGENILGTGWVEKEEFMAIKNLLEVSLLGIKFNKRTSIEIGPRLQNMTKCPPFQKMISLLEILNILAKKEDFELLSRDTFNQKLNQDSNRKIDLIQNYVNDNFQNQITLKEISNLVLMNEETFCRFFKRTFGKSFFTFLNEYKIKLASKQLIETNKQVSEIAFLCGYESLPFFYRQFKKFMNCTPLAYRKKYVRAFSF
ncbi:AraC family transcriptional regulator [Maribacter algarum]|uniref:AraC family transcriptional regulator n=1 Tax=Maribacter algarum (ex Zhang et al. 2020) TaxID=2578118 RepID=A0A5S3PUY7_9FLAO|nr:AraC family transcriptional regulator [Maribacter algarum]TMM56758.1 AraC family transcriptional regulator [Maribacter algarum]